jgi:hypothetical protein
MLRTTVFFLLFIGASFAMNAQDLIVKRDSSRLPVKILEIRSDQVCYQVPEAATSKSICIPSDQIAYLVFQNGYKQKFEVRAPSETMKVTPSSAKRRVLRDSASYYKFDESVSINYLNFANREFGLIYHRDYLPKHFALVVPVTIGLDKPALTHSLYFKNNFSYTVSNKIFDLGVGLSYFPTYRNIVNYFAGPMLRALFYQGQQILFPETNSPLVVKNSTLSRFSFSITNGLLIRTKSRVQMSLFASLGACYDVVANQIRRPLDNKRINPIKDPLSFYFWCGFTMGYCF